MKNYGDICLINGGQVESVDCIIGGSPCQNLSVAGNRKGLEGSESRLFLEQMRVVKEMRQATDFMKPRYMVWENVVGSLSCNNGRDFQCVLNECVETALFGKINLNKGTKDGEENITEEDRGRERYRETRIPAVPMPKDGKWNKSGILYDDMGRWSIAWRIHDAQYWGVAQRRRRIALVCDFGGMSAPEVLFESKSVSGDFNPCNTQEEGATETSVGSPEESNRIWDARGNGNGRLSATLTGDHDNRITDYTNVVVSSEPYTLDSKALSHGIDSVNNKSTGRGVRQDGISPTLTAGHVQGICNREAYSINGDVQESGVSVMSEVSHALKVTTKESVFVKSVSENSRNEVRLGDVASSLATGGGKPGQSYPCICIGNGQAHVTEHYTEEMSQTLNCMHDPMTILEPCAYPNSGCYETEQAKTTYTNGCVPNNQSGTAIMEPVRKTVVYGTCTYSSNCKKSSNPHSGVYEAETSRTLDTVSCGNPVCCQGGMAVVEPIIPIEDKLSHTIETHPIVVDRAAFNQGTNAQFDIKVEESEVVPSMVARGPHAVAQPVQYRVRRLTPLECTRLQGYPDGWVDIGDWIDSKGKKHKEANAPKYKALGNSIALPFWKWLLRNIVNQLKKDGQTTTMASLFDGIGGFPLCWAEATQSKESVIWISEIEEFPLAVTRSRFE